MQQPTTKVVSSPANAESKFQIGQRVQMTEQGLVRRLDEVNRRRTGMVAGFPVQGVGDTAKLVYVVRDGTKTKQSYHMDFWETEDLNATDCKDDCHHVE